MTQRVVFSSADLPPELNDRERFALWQDMFTATFGALDMYRPDDRPFAMRCEFARFGAVGFGQFEGTCNKAARTGSAVRADGDDGFVFIVNRRPTRMALVQNGREILLEPGAAGLVTNMEEGVFLGDAHNAWSCLRVPHRELVSRVANAEDLTGSSFQAGSAPLRHLQAYLGILVGPNCFPTDPEVAAHVDRMLIDLIALTLGTDPETAQLARMRSLRAARAQSIVAEIRRGFTDPEFSPAKVARKLGLSPRYVHDLLHETGVLFSERVMELRLEQARALLEGANGDLKVTGVAYSCGFNDLSYFNRSFRRRFGAAPTEFHRGKRAAS
jgi:AraC-like DNA-binding protein